MITLNLKTENNEQERIKEYLENNVSETLAEKINNGVYITKDDKRLLSKKDLNGFWKYATDEARKISTKGSNGAYVNDDTVFGWAIHYFEEDSFEGTLYNEDGSEYKPVKTQAKQSTKTEIKTITKPVKKSEQQFSLFDLMTKNENETVSEDTNIETDNEPTEEEIQEAINIVREEENKPKISPIYTKYMEMQKKYPDCVIAYRLGDFYEIFGENAKKVSNELDLTLTGRDFGLSERIPLVGFPYHAADNYINKIIEFSNVAIVEQDNVEIKKKTINVDYETGEILDLTEEEMREFDGDIGEPNNISDDEIDDTEIVKTAKSIDKDFLIKLYNLLDGKLEIR